MATTNGRAKPCKDHRGTEYPSKTAMLEKYGVTRQTFHSRMKNGATLQAALETPRGQFHGGRRKSKRLNVAEAARQAGMNYSKLRYRLKNGATLQEALTMPQYQRCRKNNDQNAPRTKNKRPHAPAKPGTHGGYRPTQPCQDPYGTEFPSVRAMCAFYGRDPRTYRVRVAAGMSQKDALETPPSNSNAAKPRKKRQAAP